MCSQITPLVRTTQRSHLTAFLAFVLLMAFSSNADAAPSSPAPRPALVLQLGNPFSGRAWSFAAHAPLLAIGISTGVQLWDTRTWELRRTILIPRDDPNQSPSALDLALSPDGKLLAAATANASIEIWETASGAQRRVIRHAPAVHLLFTTDGKEIIGSGPGNLVEGQGGQTTFWNVHTGKRRLRLPTGGDFALSSDGRRAAVVAYASTATASKAALWDAQTGRNIGTLADGSGVFGPLDFSPNGRQIVTVGEDPKWVPPSGGPFTEASYAHNLTLKIWDVAARKRLHVLPGQFNQLFGQGLRWSSDGKHIISTGRTILIYSPAGRRERLITDMGAALPSADANTLIAPGDSGVTSLDLRTGVRRTYRHDFLGAANVDSAAYARDGSLLATGEGNSARLWSGDAGTAGRLLPFEYLSKLFFLPDSRSLVTAGLQRIQVWDTPTGTIRHTFTNGLPEKVDTMSPDFARVMDGINLLLSPDGKTLLRKPGDALTRNAEARDAATGQMQATLQGMEQPLYTAIVSSDGTLLANQNGNGVGQAPPDPPRITVWDLHRGQRRYDFPVASPLPGPYAFSSDSKTLAVADNAEEWKNDRPTGVHSRIILHDMADGQPRLTIDVGQYQNGVRALLFSPDNRLLAVSYAGQIKCYETAMGKLIGTLALPQENLLALAFSPDAARLVTEGENFGGAGENLMRVWRVRDDRLLATLVGLVVNGHVTPDWLAFTPDGYHASSPSARRAIRFRMGDHLLSADSYPALDRPDLLRKAIQDK